GRAQPTIEAMASAAGVTPDELHHLFRRWASITPKAFMQALTLDHAKNLLLDSASVLDAALDSGLSGPGRLHDLFVTHEAMSPGEWKTGGAGMTLRYGFHPSPFGTAIVIASGRGLAGGGRRGRKKSDLVRGAVPSRARQGRRADRLSLGHHAQAGHDRLGSRTSGRPLIRHRRLSLRPIRDACRLARCLLPEITFF